MLEDEYRDAAGTETTVQAAVFRSDDSIGAERVFENTSIVILAFLDTERQVGFVRMALQQEIDMIWVSRLEIQIKHGS